MQRVPIAESIRAGHVLWRAAVPVVREVLHGGSGGEDERTAVLLGALETLQRSINIRLQVGALAHEDSHLVRQLLTREDAGTGTRLIPSIPSLGDGPGADRLTTREQQVLIEVAEGLSNREIGNRLKIAEGTVKRHLRRIFAKLGAVSRVDAINKASSRGSRPALQDSSIGTAGQ